MNSELQVGTDLQATSEAVLTNLKLLSQTVSEGLSLNAEQAASQVAVATAEGLEKLEADAESNPISEDKSQPLTRTGERNRRAHKAKAAAEWEAQQDSNVTKSLIAAEEGVSPAVRQLARKSRRAGPGGSTRAG